MNPLLAHLERDLGRYEGAGLVKPEADLPFSLRQFRDRPEDGVTSTVTYGIGEHVVVGSDARETIRLPVELDRELDLLVAAAPEPFPARFARCRSFEPPIEIVWLVPFAGGEHHIVAEHGWRDLLHWLRERELDVYDLRRPSLAT